jgi:hypothetical protein
VIIENRLILGIAMIQLAGLLRAKEKILVDEGAGWHWVFESR